MKTQPGGILFSAIVAAPFGAVGIRGDAGVLRELVYLPPSYAPRAPVDALAERAGAQVARYLLDPDFVFDLPLPSVGSAFQRRVWDTIGQIGRGQVRTYGQVARQIGSAARAVGQACGANPFPLIVP